MTPFDKLRHDMVASQIVRRGVSDTRVLTAMRKVPRERFVSARQSADAYADCPLPIGHGQTISQPYIVARMAELLALQPGCRVLDIGTGSGYAAAILAEIAAEVFSIERNKDLACEASKRLSSLGYDNIHVRCGDGCLGWPEAAPFHAIAVAAGAPGPPTDLLAQLVIGGRLVIPVGDLHRGQELFLIQRTGDEVFERRSCGAVRFVPLVGKGSWGDEEEARTG